VRVQPAHHRATRSPANRKTSPRSATPSMSRTGSFRDPGPPKERSPDRQRQPVAHRAVGGAGDQREGRRLDLDTLRLRNPTIMRDQLFDQGPGATRNAGSATRTVTGTLLISVVARDEI